MDREYELFYIVRPDIDEDQVRAVMDDVAGLISGHGGEMTKSSLWGRRRLAYTVSGFNDGYYALKELTLPVEKVRELDRQLRLDERVIRHLVSLKQVYCLPGDEDRRGRVRTRGKDRGDVTEDAVPAGGELTDEVMEAEVAVDDGFAVEPPDPEDPDEDADGEE